MATTYLSPGVYVEELDLGIKPIQGVGTSTAAFIGITADASRKVMNKDTNERVRAENVTLKATMVTNWQQYTETFGGFVNMDKIGDHSIYMPEAVYNYFLNGGGPSYIVSLQALTAVASVGNSFKVSSREPGEQPDLEVKIEAVGKAAAPRSATSSPAGKPDKKSGEADTAAAPQAASSTNDSNVFKISLGKEFYFATMNPADDEGHGKDENSAVYIGKIGFVLGIISEINANQQPKVGSYKFDGGTIDKKSLTAKNIKGDVTERTGLNGLAVHDDIRIIACPDLMAGYNPATDKSRVIEVQKAMIDHCENMRYCFAVLDAPPELTVQQVVDWRKEANFDSSYAAMYYPWIQVADFESGRVKPFPPSAHVVGVYNRVDDERGVHKAPANELLRGALGVQRDLTRGELGMLNPIGINAIQSRPNQGIRIWGARTLSSNQSWRYISVRRLFIYVEASMDQGLQWVVFEPNDQDLWARVRRDVTSFLRMVWRSGALFGSNEEDAFYVKCDGELNNSDVREAGQLIIEVGLCPVKPAEFVIFRISQWAGPDSVA
jgi:hypothetical protein